MSHQGAEQDRLWQDLLDFEVDRSNTVALGFRDRLARENGWTRDFADRVVVEYKRFLYLACRAGHPVTPSDQVDQAWHLHLLYTRSYWVELTPLLPKPVHHGPTEGGREERVRYDKQYRDTLESYEHLFGTPPPVDIWPPSEIRFGRDLFFRRVNVQDNAVLPRRAVVLAAIVTRVAVTIVALAGCSASGVSDSLTPIVLTVVALLFGVARLAQPKGSPGNSPDTRTVDEAQSSDGKEDRRAQFIERAERRQWVEAVTVGVMVLAVFGVIVGLVAKSAAIGFFTALLLLGAALIASGFVRRDKPDGQNPDTERGGIVHRRKARHAAEFRSTLRTALGCVAFIALMGVVGVVAESHQKGSALIAVPIAAVFTLIVIGAAADSGTSGGTGGVDGNDGGCGCGGCGCGCGCG